LLVGSATQVVAAGNKVDSPLTFKNISKHVLTLAAKPPEGLSVVFTAARGLPARQLQVLDFEGNL
jgi:hypothetical protein